MKPQYDGEEAPSGSRFGCESYTCPKCNGLGSVQQTQDPKKPLWVTCTNCNGDGEVAD